MKLIEAENIIIDLKNKYNVDLDALIKTIKDYNPDFNEKKFKDAFVFATIAHHGQTRKQENLPYIIHPFETVKILTQIHADEPTLIAALLHDVPEDTSYTLENIETRFGKQIAYMVEGITKLSKVHYRHDMQQRDIESMKKLFVHVAEDPRTMLIKLADRLHNMRTLEYMDVTEKKIRKARETLEIFTPIANLLGIREIQMELEDLCFLHLYPDDYKNLKNKVQEIKKENSKYLSKMVSDTEKSLKDYDIDAIVYSYQENLYRTYKRMKRENQKIEDIETILFVNIIVSEISQCYQSLGIVHSLYKMKPSKFKDYISLPKANGYRSIHTTVFGIKGITTKFCIRTTEMHYEAQYGIAASYFENKGKKPISTATRASWVEEVLQFQQDKSFESKYLDELKNSLLKDRINVLTPHGKILELPIGSTAIDFAYNIHTEVGHRAMCAIVNGHNTSLDYILKKGDIVKIITTDYPKAPSYEWLNYAKTTIAIKRIKDYFKKESYPAKVQLGRKILQKEFDRAGIGVINSLPKWRIQLLSEAHPSLNIQTTEDIFVNVAEGSISPLEVVNSFTQSGIKSKYKGHSPKEAISIKEVKPTKFNLRLIGKQVVNPINVLNIIQKYKDNIELLSSEVKTGFFSKKLIFKTSMKATHYKYISLLCRDLENIDGVEEVQRLFRSRRIIFFLGSFITFLIWIYHPLALKLIASQQQLTESFKNLLANIVLFAGLLFIFALILLLNHFTERSLPEFRDTKKFWTMAYILSSFALMTIFLEIFLIELTFDWAWVLGTIALIFGYLTMQYIYYKGKKKLE